MLMLLFSYLKSLKRRPVLTAPLFLSLPCGTAAAYYLPRHLAPNPAYPHPYPYLIRGFPDTAALENRQTLLNDYITSQQMHQWPAAAAMAAQRSDLLRGLTPRDQPLQLPYSAAPRGNSVMLTWVFFVFCFVFWVCQNIFSAELSPPDCYFYDWSLSPISKTTGRGCLVI